MLLGVPFRKCLTRMTPHGTASELETLPRLDIPRRTCSQCHRAVAKPFRCPNGEKGNRFRILHIGKVLAQIETARVHSLRSEPVEIIQWISAIEFVI